MNILSFSKSPVTLLIVLSVCLIFTGCSEKISGPVDGGPYPPNSAVFDVEWNDKTVIISEAKRTALTGIDTTYHGGEVDKIIGVPENTSSGSIRKAHPKADCLNYRLILQ